jgi:hypothetical protein
MREPQPSGTLKACNGIALLYCAVNIISIPKINRVIL